MAYTMPPNANTNNDMFMQLHREVRPQQNERSMVRVRYNVTAKLPGMRIVEIFSTSKGQPYKVYVRDAHNHLHTVNVNGSQAVTGIVNGCQ